MTQTIIKKEIAAVTPTNAATEGLREIIDIGMDNIRADPKTVQPKDVLKALELMIRYGDMDTDPIFHQVLQTMKKDIPPDSVIGKAMNKQTVVSDDVLASDDTRGG